jgi:hypothetical protein
MEISLEEFQNLPEYIDRIGAEFIKKGQGVFSVTPLWKPTKNVRDIINKIDIQLDEQEKVLAVKLTKRGKKIVEKEAKGFFRVDKKTLPGKITVGEYFQDQKSFEYSDETEQEIWNLPVGFTEKYGLQREPIKLNEKGVFLIFPGTDSILNQLPPIDGVHKPYLYFARYGTVFPLHFENGKLHSVSYLHFGAPKVWIGIHLEDTEKLLKILSGKIFKSVIVPIVKYIVYNRAVPQLIFFFFFF